jgi:RNA polymerase sigma-54 factor
LQEHLLHQAALVLSSEAERNATRLLIEHLDEAGYLPADEMMLETLGWPRDRYLKLLAKLHGLEPVGVFARSLAECLALQLRERGRCDPAMTALLENLDLLASGDRLRLLALCGVDDADLDEMVAELRRLNPRPAAGFDGSPVPCRIPDVIAHVDTQGRWTVELNLETLPRLGVNRNYAAELRFGRSARYGREPETRDYVRARLNEASWLVRALEQRTRTILAVARAIVMRQQAFLDHGIAHLRPLILQDIGAEIGVHESTVSRAVANKYMETPRGTFELKFFFSSGLASRDGSVHSAESVRQRIADLVGSEKDILSDEDIVRALGREGLGIARRTVAKYRESLRIPCSLQRRRLRLMGLR